MYLCVFCTYFVALKVILQHKSCIRQCESLSPYSEFLGLHVTSGVHKKTEQLANLITHPLVLKFLLQYRSGHEKLARYLSSQGMLLSKDGEVTTNPKSNKKNYRYPDYALIRVLLNFVIALQ